MTIPTQRDEEVGLESYAAGPADTPLLEETIGSNFERTASTYPDVEALVDVAGDRRWTYAELNAEIDCVARALMVNGITRGIGSVSGRPTARNGRFASTPRPRSGRMVGQVRSEVRYVHIVDEFPMTVTGKVRKVDMRAESVRLLGL